eukprot:TRINITY_DN17136_c0_g1_i2.p1 TRINITY_DN17136_c0_g1~~TRINITY_DN17136_c0_g1_i2.p1  ORF type:complete len:106 (-),score=14.98 TRINITY_DN17136_c0_g1_i2:165-482(-)
MQEAEIDGSDATVDDVPESSWSKSMAFFKREKGSARTSFNMGPSTPYMASYVVTPPVPGHRHLIRVAHVPSPALLGGASGGEDGRQALAYRSAQWAEAAAGVAHR